ncbi:hypothetical protein MMC08_008319 [Hypocenomyce scalaris]|nr:hypothetical protein [Hypocenomyce scalaris]
MATTDHNRVSILTPLAQTSPLGFSLSEKGLENGHVQHAENVQHEPSAALADVLAENVSYGPRGVSGLLSSPYVFGAAFLASLGGFSFGYDQGLMSIVNVMPQFHDRFPITGHGTTSSGFYTGLMTGMLELGAFLGCFFMPKLADKISRKWALSVAVGFYCVGAIIQTASQSYATLVVGRTIGGIGVGTLAMGAPLYISEISPPQLRGALLVLESISICSGVVISYWITYGTRLMSGQIAFRLPFGLQLISAILLGVCIHFFPYSPRWLALVGRPDDALLSLCKLRSLPNTDERVLAEHRGILAEVEFQKIVLERHHPGARGFKLELLTWLDLFRKGWRRTAVGMGVAFFQQFSGVNAFIYYAPTLFSEIGQDYDNSLILSGVLNITQLVAVTVCFFFIDYVGRRRLAIWWGFSMGVPYVILAVLVGLYSSDWAAHKAAGWGAVAAAFAYMCIYGSSYNALGWALPPEVFPNASRAKGVAISTATVWLCNFIIGVAVPVMLKTASFGTYIFFACLCFLSGVWAYFLVPETKGKTLEEMDAIFGDTSAQEEKEIVRQLTLNRKLSADAVVNEETV